ncbi:MAG TPA: hypothetical protein VFM34_06935 [Moraxellaceae bacterium]|nr:hypothetical protein [Moraxellaceae bacterium]
MSIGMGKALDVYSLTLQRQKEQELLYVGDIYRKAIHEYYLEGPGGQRKYPESLNDLLLDKRFVTVRRHLRRLYPDPLTGKPFRLLMAPEGGIWGVASTAKGRPIKVAGFAEEYVGFESAVSYQDWQFMSAGR